MFSILYDIYLYAGCTCDTMQVKVRKTTCRSWFFPSTMEFLGTKVKLPNLAACAFTP